MSLGLCCVIWRKHTSNPGARHNTMAHVIGQGIALKQYRPITALGLYSDRFTLTISMAITGSLGSYRTISSARLLYTVITSIKISGRIISSTRCLERYILCNLVKYRYWQSARNISSAITRTITLGMNLNLMIQALTQRLLSISKEGVSTGITSLTVVVRCNMKGAQASKILSGVNVLQIGSQSSCTIDYSFNVVLTGLGSCGMKVALLL